MNLAAVPERRGVPLLSDALSYARDPLALLRSIAREQGPIAAFRAGPLRYVLLSDASANERVLTAPYQVAARPRNNGPTRALRTG